MSSEVLPSLFSELMSSASDGDRLRTRIRFEGHYQVLDAKLTHLVKSDNACLSHILQTAGRTSQGISASREKCRCLKKRIIACQEILARKRDDLRRLWVESLERNYVHLLLVDIGKLRRVPNTVNEHLLGKKYVEATEILVASISYVETDLENIGGLVSLEIELRRLLDKLYSIFIDELRQELFMSTFGFVFRGTHDTEFEEIAYEKVFGCQLLKESTESIQFNVSYIETLLKCISMMKKVPEALEILKDGCLGELMKIIQKLSKYMCDIISKSIDVSIIDLPSSKGDVFLSDLLGTILGHFRQISINQEMFFQVLKKVVKSDELKETCYEMEDLYSSIQTVLESFVTNYLEAQTGLSLERQNSSVLTNSRVCDISAYFLHPRDSEAGGFKLFKFSHSDQGLARRAKRGFIDKHLQSKSTELSEEFSNKRSQKFALVCKPCLRNITIMFGHLKSFVSEVEKAMNYDPGSCALHVFINDCANSFLDQVNAEINRILESSSCSLESWAVSMIPNQSLDKSGSEQHILSSTIFLYDNLKEMSELMRHIPDYALHFLQLFYYVVQDYKTMAQKVFEGLFSEVVGILSVSWATDEDINRLLKTFSNWKFLEVSESGEMIESPEDIRLRNKEESELLIRNLHSKEGSSWHIISDYSVLYNIAVLEESLQWFSRKLSAFGRDFISVDTLPQDASEGIAQPKSLDDLKKEVKGYEEFSDTCLMALHLEIRAHCFHHLLKFSEGSQREEMDVCLQNLTNDIMKIDDHLYPVLSPKEFKYVFEGLGELISSILIHSVSKILANVPESSVKRISHSIFVVQCCLSNITMARETSLEKARQYFQLLNQPVDDILNEIVEEGPRFKEHEYVSIFRLVVENPDTLHSYAKKLKKIFKGLSANL